MAGYSDTRQLIIDTLMGRPAATPPPASGKLTRVSGSGDSVINYSSVVQSSGNPFWNDELARLDFPAYVNKWCASFRRRI